MRPSSLPTKNSRVRLARYRQPCLLVVVIGVALDMVSFIGLRRIEYQNARVAFENVARERLDQMEAHLALTLHSLTALGAFYDGAKVIGREDFRRFANSVLTRDGAVDALEWAPRVPQRLRAAYVSSAGNSGLAAFEITERSADGRLVIAGERAEYFPVERVEPLRGNEKAIGFDLASNPTRRRALERSVATGQLSATSRILVQETHDQYGMLVFRPVYRSGSPPAGVAARREALVGLVLGVIRLRDLVEKVGPSATASADLRVAVFDRSAAPPEQLLYPKRAPFGATKSSRGLPGDADGSSGGTHLGIRRLPWFRGVPTGPLEQLVSAVRRTVADHFVGRVPAADSVIGEPQSKRPSWSAPTPCIGCSPFRFGVPQL